MRDQISLSHILIIHISSIFLWECGTFLKYKVTLLLCTSNLSTCPNLTTHFKFPLFVLFNKSSSVSLSVIICVQASSYSNHVLKAHKERSKLFYCTYFWWGWLLKTNIFCLCLKISSSSQLKNLPHFGVNDPNLRIWSNSVFFPNNSHNLYFFLKGCLPQRPQNLCPCK